MILRRRSSSDQRTHIKWANQFGSMTRTRTNAPLVTSTVFLLLQLKSLVKLQTQLAHERYSTKYATSAKTTCNATSNLEEKLGQRHHNVSRAAFEVQLILQLIQ